ncbi:MAG: ABC transporter substrate-binding protein, partial [Calditrichaceae bacterium]
MRYFPEILEPTYDLMIDGSQIYSQIYESLVVLDSDCKTINPHLAVDWKISKDKCTYTFYLRNNVYFHDGTKLSTRSVSGTYEYLRNIEYGSEIFDHASKINIIDSLTFQFVLKKPYSNFLNVLASPENFQLMSENALLEYGKDVGWHPVGTGPFKMDHWADKQYITLEKYSKYWG